VRLSSRNFTTSAMRISYFDYGEVASIKCFDDGMSVAPELIFQISDWEILKMVAATSDSVRLRQLFVKFQALEDGVVSFPTDDIYRAFEPLARALGVGLGTHGAITRPGKRNCLIRPTIELWARDFDESPLLSATFDEGLDLLWLFANQTERHQDPSLLQFQCELDPASLYKRFQKLPGREKRERGYRWEAVSRQGQTLLIQLSSAQFGDKLCPPHAMGPIISSGATWVPSKSILAPSRRSQAKHLSRMMQSLLPVSSVFPSAIAA